MRRAEDASGWSLDHALSITVACATWVLECLFWVKIELTFNLRQLLLKSTDLVPKVLLVFQWLLFGLLQGLPCLINRSPILVNSPILLQARCLEVLLSHLLVGLSVRPRSRGDQVQINS